MSGIHRRGIRSRNGLVQLGLACIVCLSNIWVNHSPVAAQSQDCCDQTRPLLLHRGGALQPLRRFGNPLWVEPCPPGFGGVDSSQLDFSPDGPAVGDPAVADPSDPAAASPSPQAAPFSDMGMLARGAGAGRSGPAAGHGMVGDFFGGGTTMTAPLFGLSNQIPLSSAGGDRRYKLTENTSPFPVDRVFYNFHYFKHAVLTADERETSVRRNTVGIEKTFLGGLMSLEGRLPFAYGMDSTQEVFGSDNQGTELGNMSLTAKVLLMERQFVSVAAGMGMIFPTASDTRLLDEDRNTVLQVSNQAYHFQPFLGVHLQPTNSLWLTMFTQVDLTGRGNRVLMSDPSGENLSLRGIYQDQHLFFADISMGYWLLDDPSRGFLTGLAPIIELHYSSMINDSDNIIDQVTGTQVTNPHNRLDALNITGALRFRLRDRSFLTISGVAPLRDGPNKLFDSEIGAQFVRLY